MTGDSPSSPSDPNLPRCYSTPNEPVGHFTTNIADHVIYVFARTVEVCSKCGRVVGCQRRDYGDMRSSQFDRRLVYFKMIGPTLLLHSLDEATRQFPGCSINARMKQRE